MLTRHITYEKQCLMCKIVSGTGFAAFAIFNIWRTKSLFPYMNIKDKLFNVSAISLVFGISGLNYLYAYRIHMG